jgi:hypothetical protein
MKKEGRCNGWELCFVYVLLCDRRDGKEEGREKDFVACRNLDLISSYHIFRCFILIFDLFEAGVQRGIGVGSREDVFAFLLSR